MKDYQRVERHERDAAAAGYEAWYVETKGRLFDWRERALFRAVMGDVSGQLVLDVGAGTGRIAGDAAAAGAAVVATDFSVASVAVLARTKPGVAGVVSDALAGLPVRTATADVASACQVYQHFRPGDLEPALSELARCLSGRGRIVLSGYNGSYFRYRGDPEIWYENGLYARRSTARELAAIAARVGLRMTSHRYYRVLPLQRLRSRWWVDADRLASRLAGARFGSYLLVVFERADRQ